MAGNSQRKGAIKKSGKGNPTVGSGGRVRRGLEGRGPTPKAQDRPNHKVYKARNKVDKSAAARPKRRTTGTTDAEWVAGRNSVVEALRARIPITGVYVASATGDCARRSVWPPNRASTSSRSAATSWTG
jgi:23S rRNA (guanosine2251-2'-O)-methyltransferase